LVRVEEALVAATRELGDLRAVMMDWRANEGKGKGQF